MFGAMKTRWFRMPSSFCELQETRQTFSVLRCWMNTLRRAVSMCLTAAPLYARLRSEKLAKHVSMRENTVLTRVMFCRYTMHAGLHLTYSRPLSNFVSGLMARRPLTPTAKFAFSVVLCDGIRAS